MSREEVLLEIARLSQMGEPRFSLMEGPRIIRELWALIGNSDGIEKPTTPTSESLCEYAARRRADNMQAFLDASAAQLEAIAPHKTEFKGDGFRTGLIKLKKRGRPKIYPDRKTQMRELMRKRRSLRKP